jgi:hypothetical protein
MGIAEFLDAPDSALLIAVDGEVELVTTKHETATRLIIERFPLGPVANVNAVRALLDLPVEAEVVRPAPQLVDTGADDAPALVCPECGRGFAKTTGLGSHRKVVHGVAGKGGWVAAPGDFACPDCPATFAKQRALGMHRLRRHGVNREPRRAPVTGEHQCATCEARFETPMALDMHEMKVHRLPPPTAVAMAAAVATPDDSESIPAPTPVPLDVAPLSESPVKSRRQPTPKLAPVADGVCPMCHEPMVTHEQCDGCDVLIGPNHGTTHGTFISGANYCRDCAEARIVARKAELVAA